MIHDLERLLDQAAREARRRDSQLRAVTLAGGDGTSAVLRVARELLARRGHTDVPVHVEDPSGDLRLVQVEMQRAI